jgi:hypothetical protein
MRRATVVDVDDVGQGFRLVIVEGAAARRSLDGASRKPGVDRFGVPHQLSTAKSEVRPLRRLDDRDRCTTVLTRG